MPKKKRRKTTKARKKNQNTGITWAIVGLLQIVISALTFAKFGILGKQVANTFRLVFGDSYLLAAGICIVFGLVMLIYNKPMHFNFKRSCGLFFAILGILLIQSSIYFER